MKKPTLSVIIPVYNEERHIAACLDAVFAQIEPPSEVIVVDNNCTDRTIEIARQYSGVKIIREKSQGLIAARNRGFAEARGTILCRIDTDAVLKPDWTMRVRKAFEQDTELAGLTGLALTRVLPRIPLFRTRFYSYGYFWWTWYLFRAQVLWGANMAIRRVWWDKAKKTINHDSHAVHEDQDLSLSVMSQGGRIKLDGKLLIITDGQTYNYAPKLLEYIKRAINTRRINQLAGRWPVREELRTPWWRFALSIVLVYTLHIGFLLGSVVLWPLDKLMIALEGEGRWID